MVKDKNSKGKVSSKPTDKEHVELPYKLIVKYGEIELLDGDVIHAGGIKPSGPRWHAYIGYVATVEGSSKVISDSDDIPFYDICTISYTDYNQIK